MEWLRIAALIATMTDGVYTCKKINDGFKELNPLMPKTCSQIMIRKSIMAAPMFIIPIKPIRNTFIVANLASGSIGFALTIRGTR